MAIAIPVSVPVPRPQVPLTARPARVVPASPAGPATALPAVAGTEAAWSAIHSATSSGPSRVTSTSKPAAGSAAAVSPAATPQMPSGSVA